MLKKLNDKKKLIKSDVGKSFLITFAIKVTKK